MQENNGLKLTLRAKTDAGTEMRDIKLESIFENVGDKRINLTFWWNRFIEIQNAETGEVIAPGPGPVRPCGMGEDITSIDPQKSFDREEYIGCTQPAGQTQNIGWSYDLKSGRYNAKLIFEYPPSRHNYGGRQGGLWQGKVVSNSVSFSIS